MIEYKKGNILSEETEAIVNTVNCVGVMVRGTALQFKNAFPGNFKAYARACRRNEVKPGRMFVYTNEGNENPRFIINFPTKRHWRGDSRLEDIRTGLDDLVKVVRENNVQSIAIPPLGCGLGGLDWNEVKDLIKAAFSEYAGQDLCTIVYTPDKSTLSRPTRPISIPEMTDGRAALIVLMQHYINGLFDPTVSLLEAHKLMYFLNESGEQAVSKLKFVEGHYGPFATNLSHVLKAIEGYFVSGFKDGGDQPTKELSLIPGTTEDAVQFIRGNKAIAKNIHKVSTLVSAFETPFGLELLATVHWILTRSPLSSKDELFQLLYAWNKHKRQFTEAQINLAAHRLANEGWLSRNVVQKLKIGEHSFSISLIRRILSGLLNNFHGTRPISRDLTKAI